MSGLDVSQFYTYNGSLTRKPCGEKNVKWVLLKNPVSISEEQAKALAKGWPETKDPVWGSPKTFKKGHGNNRAV